MAEEKQTENQAAGEERQFAIQRIYLKDTSYESPQAPQIFAKDSFAPNISVQLNTDAKPINDQGLFNVVLTVTVEAKEEEKSVSLVEVQQAGIFTVSGFQQAEMGQMLGSFCPNILFPYAREAISDLITKGGFPQMVLAPVNFDALYAQHQQQQQAQQKAAAEVTH